LIKQASIVTCSEPANPVQAIMATAKAPLDDIAGAILVLRGQRVLLDSDIAVLYGVATKALLQAVKRNLERFPADFMLRLTVEEWAALRSQNVTSKPRRGGRRYPPYVFTEQGVAMLSSVLASRHAIAVNIQIMRTFVQLREVLGANKDLARRFAQLEVRLDKKLGEHDAAIAAILSAIRQLMNPSTPKRRGIGFTADIQPKR
jgi:hypothetical protein